jgi:hypothetical protein
MLPSILAKQLREGLADYILAAFPMTTPAFKDSIPQLLATKDAVFHEPYVGVRLPFRVAEEMPEDFFTSLHLKYKPYVHQQKAFERLTGDDGLSTLIATGTGSGKTECFLYPILEYCYKHRSEKGVKALIIYPMNALATDQAKRLAELIYTSPKLRSNITAGMYVGGFESSPGRAMTAEKIITSHETLLSSPPDILLTNYKMLDYLLVRPQDASLWNDNHPETLKYIAVDELHSFDGAQGTDLACLLRRLKSRLYTPAGHLCCIGTSATMGNRESAAGIAGYAAKMFGEPFENNAVITEDRLKASEFFAGSTPTDFTVPDPEALTALRNAAWQDNQTDFLEVAAQSWLDESFVYDEIMSPATRLALGSHLYHKDKVADDTLKREALRRSGKYRIWSLSWQDVQSVFKAQWDYATATLNPGRMPSGDSMYIPAVQAARAEVLRPDRMQPLELLAQYLENPEAEQLFSSQAKAYALSLLAPGDMSKSVIFADWQYNVHTISDMLALETPTFELGKSIFGIWQPRTENVHLTVYAGVEADDLHRSKFAAEIIVYAVLNDRQNDRTDKYEPEWHGFWQFYNVLQFLPSFTAVTTEGLQGMIYHQVPWQMAPPEAAPAAEATWPVEIMELLFDDRRSYAASWLSRWKNGASSCIPLNVSLSARTSPVLTAFWAEPVPAKQSWRCTGPSISQPKSPARGGSFLPPTQPIWQGISRRTCEKSAPSRKCVRSKLSILMPGSVNSCVSMSILTPLSTRRKTCGTRRSLSPVKMPGSRESFMLMNGQASWRRKRVSPRKNT